MKGALLLLAGAAIGFVIAHEVARTEKGKEFFDDIDHKTKEFSDAVIRGYKAREAELRDVAKSVVDDLTGSGEA